ncbi:MAG: hypothetical protein ABI859_08130 [Pseudomonadota bacterium]
MTQATPTPAKQISGVAGGTEGEARPRQTSEGILLKRRRRRRLDLKTLHGTLRESARVYREVAEGRISMAEGEVRSRMLRRHGEILAEVSLEQHRDRLYDQLLTLKQSQGALPDGLVNDLLASDGQSVHTSPRQSTGGGT